VKPETKQSNRNAAFTIVELMTVMSIIIILIGLLVPALNRVKRYAKRVRQKAQFHSIDVAMELVNTEFDGYPDSFAQDEVGQPYCGAMRLCEAMMGQDLLGFHPDSHFRSDGTIDGTGATQLYPVKGPPISDIAYNANLKTRKGPYLQLENANAYKLKDIYPDAGLFNNERFVLCDVYTRVTNLGLAGRSKIGMPILYYKANTNNVEHDDADPKVNIYNYLDNDQLVLLGMPWNPLVSHPISSGGGLTSTGAAADPYKYFYDKYENDDYNGGIRDKKITTAHRPYNSDSYILMSAGFDGEYGTRDDVFNFGD